MVPIVFFAPRAVAFKPDDDEYTREQAIVEGWAQGFNVGAIVLLILLLLCNYRKRVLLHKLILLELVLALTHGFFIFFADPAYGWILSSTAVTLYISYSLHNVISWIKIKPFLPGWGSLFFIITLGLVQPYWVLETWANFEYFNSLGTEAFKTTRFLEPLMRDPWWVFTTIKLVVVIKQNYEYTFTGLIRASPRFGVMLLCMLLSIVFLVTDVVITARVSKQSGINPFWRLALVFKCASDTIFLDDFKSVLDDIAESALKRIMSLPYISNNDRRKSSTARPSGIASHHEHNPGPQVSISANRGEDELGQSRKRGWSLGRSVSKRSRDSGEEALVGGPADQPGHIVAETTISVTDNDHGRRPWSNSRRDMGPRQYSDEDTSHYDLGQLSGRNLSPNDGAQEGIPMVPMRARTTTRPFS